MTSPAEPDKDSPQPEDLPSKPQKKRPALKWALIGAGIALLAALIVVPVFIAANRNARYDDMSTAAAPPDPTYGSEEWPTEDPGSEPDFTEPPVPDYTPEATDWKLKIKVTDKTCYGSGMGCSQTLKITPQYVGTDRASLPDSGLIELTYRLTGDSNGPVVGSLDIYPADQTSEVGEQYIDTPSSGTKIKAVVTDIDYNAYG